MSSACAWVTQQITTMPPSWWLDCGPGRGIGIPRGSHRPTLDRAARIAAVRRYASAHGDFTAADFGEMVERHADSVRSWIVAAAEEGVVEEVGQRSVKGKMVPTYRRSVTGAAR